MKICMKNMMRELIFITSSILVATTISIVDSSESNFLNVSDASAGNEYYPRVGDQIFYAERDLSYVNFGRSERYHPYNINGRYSNYNETFFQPHENYVEVPNVTPFYFLDHRLQNQYNQFTTRQPEENLQNSFSTVPVRDIINPRTASTQTKTTTTVTTTFPDNIKFNLLAGNEANYGTNTNQSSFCESETPNLSIDPYNPLPINNRNEVNLNIQTNELLEFIQIYENRENPRQVSNMQNNGSQVSEVRTTETNQNIEPTNSIAENNPHEISSPSISSGSVSDNSEKNEIMQDDFVEDAFEEDACFSILLIQYIDDIIKIMKETKINNLTDSNNLFLKLETIIQPSKCKKFFFKKDSQNGIRKQIRKVFDSIDNLLSNPSNSESVESPLDLLDSSTFVKAYLFLLSSFSAKFLQYNKQYFKKKIEEKKTHIQTLPKNSANLIVRLDDAIPLFQVFSLGNPMSSLFFEILNFYKVIFHIQETKNETMQQVFNTVTKEEERDIESILKNFNKSLKSINCIRHIRVKTLDYLLKKDMEHGYMKYIKNVLDKLDKHKTYLKSSIEEHFANSKLTSFYIYYRMTILLLQRIFMSSNKPDELMEGLKVFKDFVQTSDKYFAPFIENSTFHNLKEKDINHLIKNDFLLYEIMLYIHLNLVYSHLHKIDKVYSGMLELVKNWECININCIKEQLTEIRKSHSSIKQTIENLEGFVNVIMDYIKELKQHIYWNKLADSINEEVRKIVLILLDSPMNYPTHIQIQSNMNQSYDRVIELYNTLFTVFEIY